jgi:hypothetical protein
LQKSTDGKTVCPTVLVGHSAINATFDPAIWKGDAGKAG